MKGTSPNQKYTNQGKQIYLKETPRDTLVFPQDPLTHSS